MREIKFRAWDKRTKELIQIQGFSIFYTVYAYLFGVSVLECIAETNRSALALSIIATNYRYGDVLGYIKCIFNEFRIKKWHSKSTSYGRLYQNIRSV